MSKSVKVSVVIPTYNSAEYLSEAIDSVLSQSYDNWEILIVDDGSTDNTRDIIKKYDNSIKYYYKKNEGVSKARNFGIEKAQGKYVAFLDSDDYWEVDKLERQVASLENENISGRACYSSFTLFEGGFNIVGVRKSERYSSALEDLMLQCNVVGTPSTVIVERSLFDNVGGFDPALSLCADWEMWIRLATVTEFIYIEEPLIKYRLHESNMSNNATLLEEDTLKLLEKAFSLENISKKIIEKKNKAYAKNYMILAGTYFQTRRYKDFIRCASQALMLDYKQIKRIASYPVRFSLRLR